MKGIFVAGTDTGVGKTEVACLMIRELKQAGQKVGAYKPVCSGAIEDLHGDTIWEDIEKLYDATNAEFARELICPQHFIAPLAPVFAAHEEGTTVDEQMLKTGFDRWKGLVDYLIIEGAGGLLSPLSERLTNAAFARKTGAPVILVGRLGLGTINHTLLSLQCCDSFGLPVGGVILSETSPSQNDPSQKINLREIAKRTPHRVIGQLPFHKMDSTLNSANKIDNRLVYSNKPILVDWTTIADEIDFVL